VRRHDVGGDRAPGRSFDLAEAEITRHLANVATGRLDLATSPMISAWGRKPATATP
jgi:hypothetical protein